MSLFPLMSAEKKQVPQMQAPQVYMENGCLFYEKCSAGHQPVA